MLAEAILVHGVIGYKFCWLLPSEDRNQGTSVDWAPINRAYTSWARNQMWFHCRDHWEDMNQLVHQLGTNHFALPRREFMPLLYSITYSIQYILSKLLHLRNCNTHQIYAFIYQSYTLLISRLNCISLSLIKIVIILYFFMCFKTLATPSRLRSSNWSLQDFKIQNFTFVFLSACNSKYISLPSYPNCKLLLTVPFPSPKPMFEIAIHNITYRTPQTSRKYQIRNSNPLLDNKRNYFLC